MTTEITDTQRSLYILGEFVRAQTALIETLSLRLETMEKRLTRLEGAHLYELGGLPEGTMAKAEQTDDDGDDYIDVEVAKL